MQYSAVQWCEPDSLHLLQGLPLSLRERGLLHEEPGLVHGVVHVKLPGLEEGAELGQLLGREDELPLGQEPGRALGEPLGVRVHQVLWFLQVRHRQLGWAGGWLGLVAAGLGI